MAQNRGADQGGEDALMRRSVKHKLPSAFMDQLIDWINPHQPPVNDALRTAQRACARWLAIRRLRLGLSIKTLADMSGLSEAAIQRLEIGMATPASLPQSARRHLASRINPNRDDAILIAQVIDIAAGQAEALSVQTLDRVFRDLDVFDTMAEERELKLAVELAKSPPPEAAGDPKPVDPAVLQSQPDMYEVLRVIVLGASHMRQIAKKLHELGVSISLAQVGVLINLLKSNEMIAREGEHLDPALPGKPAPLYRITDKGRQAFNLERTTRLVQEAQAVAQAQAADSEMREAPPDHQPLPET